REMSAYIGREDYTQMTQASYINIRFLSSVASEDEAAELGRSLMDAFRDLGNIVAFEVKKYWKIPECYECSMELHAEAISDATLPILIERLGHGWERVSSACFIWNRSEEFRFADERVNWAEVEFIEV
ncbi:MULTISPECIES: hypothetical protein, partial [unclassified Labrenzia]|uniref:hypothetical protein n=1 Tax=unclassified Labrenzia TaxID=2648686 RepID=UPI000569C227